MFTKCLPNFTKFVPNLLLTQFGHNIKLFQFTRFFPPNLYPQTFMIDKKLIFPALSHDAFYFLSPLKLYQMVKHIILWQNPYKHGLYPFSSTCYLGIVPDNSEWKGDTNKVRFSVVLPYFGGDSWICNSSWLIGN